MILLILNFLKVVQLSWILLYFWISFASVNVEVRSELVDPLVEFSFWECLVFTSISFGSILNPFPVLFRWSVVSGLGKSFESTDELLFVNLSIIVSVDSFKNLIWFWSANTLVLGCSSTCSTTCNFHGRSSGNESNNSEFHFLCFFVFINYNLMLLA